MKLYEAQIINPSKPIQFRAAAYLAAQSPKRTAAVLSDISRDNPGRAAALLVDINNLAGNAFSASIRGALSSGPRSLISESIEKMPTRDAARFMIDVLGKPAFEALAPAHAAWSTMDPETSANNDYLTHIYGENASEIAQIVSSSMNFRSIFDLPVIGSDQEGLTGFYSWAAKIFPPENYGYQNVWDQIKPGSGDATLPKTKHLDGKKGQPHQCFHTATAARGYFSQLGIPTEVFCFTVPYYGSHNVAVAFLEHGDKFSPALVDASPFRGGYSLRSAADFRPFDWNGISTANDFKYPLVRQATMWAKSPGSIPWACIPLENGMHTILSAEILQRLKHPNRALERGTAEYYGRGETTRSIGFSVGLIMPDKNSCFEFELPIKARNRKKPIDIKDISAYQLEAFHKEVGPQTILSLIIDAAQSPAMRFLSMIKGSGLI